MKYIYKGTNRPNLKPVAQCIHTILIIMFYYYFNSMIKKNNNNLIARFDYYK